MDKYEQYDLDEAVEIADDTWSVDLEKENARKKSQEIRYKKGGHNRCQK